MLEFTAKKHGEKPCIKYKTENGIVTKAYSDLFRASADAAAAVLQAAPQRAHVAIIGKTSYSYLCFFNGIFMSGNVAVPLSPELSEDEIFDCMSRADVSAVVFDDYTADRVMAVSEKLPLALIPVGAAASAAAELPEINPDDCAMIMFTSGTTGDKKGVMLSSRAIISNVLFKEMSYEGNHVALNVLPIYHIFCFSCDYLKNLLDGVTICLNGEMTEFFDNLLVFEPSVLRLVPMLIDGLLKKVRIIKRLNPDLTDRECGERVFGKNLHSIIASGAYLNADMGEEFEKMGINIRQGYGMTETGPRIAVPNGRTSIQSVGVVIDICEIRTVGGEIQVKSPSLMMGYYKDDAATKEVFTKDGWFMTGDMGYVGDDRQLYITGRKKNVIILSNGENVSPEEIEKKLSECDAGEEVLVYGEGNRLTAEFYVPSESPSEHTPDESMKNIRQFVRRYNKSVINEKEISVIKFRSNPFEKTSTGKIKRKAVIY